MKMKRGFLFFVIPVLLFTACASVPRVQRVDPSAQPDLSGNWNANDVRIVCEDLINKCINSPRVSQAISARRGRTPFVLVGRFNNESSEHIETSIISTTMEVAIFNSGRLNFVAGGSTREELRSERQDQLSNASEATASALGNETGADFLLTGTVRIIVDRLDNQTTRTYIVNAEMSDIETTERIWMDQSSIDKIITRPKNKL